MFRQIIIESTVGKDDEGPVGQFALPHAPTWALREALQQVQRELNERERIYTLIREFERGNRS